MNQKLKQQLAALEAKCDDALGSTRQYFDVFRTDMRAIKAAVDELRKRGVLDPKASAPAAPVTPEASTDAPLTEGTTE